MLSLPVSVLEKVDHAIERIQAVKGSSRALVDTAAALDALAAKLASHRPKLLDFIKNPQDSQATANYCDIVLEDLFKLLPHVGFLHRSRNASNPFELHGPLKCIAREFVGEDVRLIISNEWEFSPYTHPSMVGIKGFVLLGLPASEAADNALLVPIAGHELGHSVWKRQGLSTTFDARLETEVFTQMRVSLKDVSAELGLTTEDDLRTERALSVRDELKDRALAQCEELFCDLCGLLLFGASYCHAFAHLLAPGLLGTQDPSYPSASARAEYLEEASEELEVVTPEGLTELFALPSADDLWSRIVHGAVDEVFEDLVKAAAEYAETRRVQSPGDKGIARAKESLEAGRPIQFTSTLPEILCAAWELRLDPDLWKSRPQWSGARHQMLNELLLKSAESLEYWQRVEESQLAK